METAPYSVLMSVYQNEKPEYLRQSLESMLRQTATPDEIVIVEDGPLTQELYAVLDEYTEQLGDRFQRIVNETNLGLGVSLARGLEHCRNELVARMDTDDIAKPDRCAKQLARLEADETLSVVGANIGEFITSPEEIVAVRALPGTHEEICTFLKKRCPMNHMTVMFRKSAVLAAGNYLDLTYTEDYYLWVRMYLNGARFANIPEILVYVRVGEDMYARRGGRKYYKCQCKLLKFMRKNKVISGTQYIKAKIVRFIVQVLMPTKMRGWAYRRFARK